MARQAAGEGASSLMTEARSSPEVRCEQRGVESKEGGGLESRRAARARSMTRTIDDSRNSRGGDSPRRQLRVSPTLRSSPRQYSCSRLHSLSPQDPALCAASARPVRAHVALFPAASAREARFIAQPRPDARLCSRLKCSTGSLLPFAACPAPQRLLQDGTHSAGPASPFAHHHRHVFPSPTSHRLDPTLPRSSPLGSFASADNRTGKTITVPVEHNSIPATAFKQLNKELAEGDRSEDEVEVRPSPTKASSVTGAGSASSVTGAGPRTKVQARRGRADSLARLAGRHPRLRPGLPEHGRHPVVHHLHRWRKGRPEAPVRRPPCA